MVQPESKVKSLEDLSLLCGERRSKGETIVLTSGCFDILHPGHLVHLTQAAGLGRLVVGINSDNFVKRMKGPYRPLQTENNRAFLMAGFQAVWRVVVFDDDYELIRKVRPDIYTLSVTSYIRAGADPERVILLNQIGARIIELGGDKIDSTTAIIRRAADSVATRNSVRSTH